MSTDITTTSLIELRSLIEHMKFMANAAVLPSPERLDTLEALDRIVAELECIDQREINK